MGRLGVFSYFCGKMIEYETQDSLFYRYGQLPLRGTAAFRRRHGAAQHSLARENGIYEVEADEIGPLVAGLIVKANPADSTLSLVCTPNFPHE